MLMYILPSDAVPTENKSDFWITLSRDWDGLFRKGGLYWYQNSGDDKGQDDCPSTIGGDVG